MEIFTRPTDDVITSYSSVESASLDRGLVKAGRAAGSGGLMMAADKSSEIDLSKQFVVFQLSNQSDGPSVLESSKVEPRIVGSRDEPDVLVALEMLSFNIGRDEGIDPDTRATLRINFGKDEASTDKRFDTVFWSLAAGLSLYNNMKNKRADGKDLKFDFHQAFGNRPIEIYGGLGRFSFEVVKHKEPPWWKRIFKFIKSETGESLVSALGFPAITRQAIDVLDELLNRLTDSEPEMLFKSLPMRMALSKYARDEFTGGNPRIKIGALTPGFCIMTRGRDFETMCKANVDYYSTYGKLVPREVSEADLMEGKYTDPLEKVTYAVFRVGMKGAKLDPTFNYG